MAESAPITNQLVSSLMDLMRFVQGVLSDGYNLFDLILSFASSKQPHAIQTNVILYCGRFPLHHSLLNCHLWDLKKSSQMHRRPCMLFTVQYWNIILNKYGVFFGNTTANYNQEGINYSIYLNASLKSESSVLILISLQLSDNSPNENHPLWPWCHIFHWCKPGREWNKSKSTSVLRKILTTYSIEPWETQKAADWDGASLGSWEQAEE